LNSSITGGEYDNCQLTRKAPDLFDQEMCPEFHLSWQLLKPRTTIQDFTIFETLQETAKRQIKKYPGYASNFNLINYG
jgi:hypothetical protein